MRTDLDSLLILAQVAESEQLFLELAAEVIPTMFLKLVPNRLATVVQETIEDSPLGTQLFFDPRIRQKPHDGYKGIASAGQPGSDESQRNRDRI